MFKNECEWTKSQTTFSDQTKGTEQSIIKDVGTSLQRDGDEGEPKLRGEGEQNAIHVGLETIKQANKWFKKRD